MRHTPDFAIQPTYPVRRAFRFHGTDYALGSLFPWRQVACSHRKLRQLYDAKFIMLEADPNSAEPVEVDEPLLGSGIQPSSFTLTNGQTVLLLTVVAETFQASGLTVAEWNALDDSTREGMIQDKVDGLELGEEPGSSVFLFDPSVHRVVKVSAKEWHVFDRDDEAVLTELTSAEAKLLMKQKEPYEFPLG